MALKGMPRQFAPSKRDSQADEDGVTEEYGAIEPFRGKFRKPSKQEDAFEALKKQRELLEELSRNDSVRGEAPHVYVETIISDMREYIERNSVIVHNPDYTEAKIADAITEQVLHYGPTILRFLARGISLPVAARAAGLIPSRAIQWVARGAPGTREKETSIIKRPDRVAHFAFYIATTRIHAYVEIYALSTVYKGSISGNDENAKWMLERTWPERYAKKNQFEEESNAGELARVVGMAIENMQKPQNALPLPGHSLKVVDAEFRVVDEAPDEND